MDVLRKELNEIYRRQRLGEQVLPAEALRLALAKVEAFAEVSGKACVVTDMSADRSHFFPGRMAGLLGLTQEECQRREISSTDEDFLYERMKPDNLAELRMLELEFFKHVGRLEPERRLAPRAIGLISMLDPRGRWQTIKKSTQMLALAPDGALWLVLCCYDMPTQAKIGFGINPIIVDNTTGGLKAFFNFEERRERLLSEREKDVLRLIKEGLLSKEIASRLQLSVNTINRHRQNILEKLAVSNSMEAVNAAIAMRLI
ncbi:MAG: LuxR C-terminal-related transcriptional regulator [Bacteroidales bacterium]|nr:LuxR C-terminal-related transcriptional regulator [Bacteroidales bacterium]